MHCIDHRTFHALKPPTCEIMQMSCKDIASVCCPYAKCTSLSLILPTLIIPLLYNMSYDPPVNCTLVA